MPNEYNGYEEFMAAYGLPGESEETKERREGKRSKYNPGDRFKVKYSPFGDLSDPENPTVQENETKQFYTLEGEEAILTKAGAALLSAEYSKMRDNMRSNALRKTLDVPGKGRQRDVPVARLNTEKRFAWREEFKQLLGPETLELMTKYEITAKVIVKNEGTEEYTLQLIQGGGILLKEYDFNRNSFDKVCSKAIAFIQSQTESTDGEGAQERKSFKRKRK